MEAGDAINRNYQQKLGSIYGLDPDGSLPAREKVKLLLVLEPLLGLLEDVVCLVEECLAVLVDRLVDRVVRFVELFRRVLRQLGQVI